MRWDSLFDDLESQLEQELVAEASDVQAEEERLRLGELRMLDRLVALAAAGASAAPLHLTLRGGDRIAVTPLVFGTDWFSARVSDRPGRLIVPLTSIAGVTMTAALVAASVVPRPGSSQSQRLTLAIVLRDLCRRRKAVEIVLADTALRGTIDRVGQDHLDVALHEPGSPRRDRVVSEYRLVPFSAVVVIRA